MRKQLTALLLLVLTVIFYFSVIGVVVGVVMFLVDPNLFYGLVLCLAVTIVLIYTIAFKSKPQFKQTVVWFLEKGPPLS